jgi:transketolase N-terminal domain/subunit
LPELYSDVISTHHYSDKSKYTEMGNLIYIANNKVKEHGYSIAAKQDDGFYEKLQAMGYEKVEIEEIDAYFLNVIKSEKELLQI